MDTLPLTKIPLVYLKKNDGLPYREHALSACLKLSSMSLLPALLKVQNPVQELHSSSNKDRVLLCPQAPVRFDVTPNLYSVLKEI